MFVLDKSVPVSPDGVSNPKLLALRAYWWSLRAGEIPRLDRFDPMQVRENLGRLHLVQVEGHRQFRFLHYGALVTNPDAADMTGKTTSDYADVRFGAFVTDQYQQAVDARDAVCAHVLGRLHEHPYEYVRMCLPLGTSRETQFLVVGTQRINVPAHLDDRPRVRYDPDVLRDQATRSRRLANTILDAATANALMGFAVAAELRAHEMEWHDAQAASDR